MNRRAQVLEDGLSQFQPAEPLQGSRHSTRALVRLLATLLWQRNERAEERARRWCVETVGDVRRAADNVAGDRRCRDDVGRAQEVRAAGVAVARAAIAG